MSPGKFRLLVGLGNPGEKYQKTRHNIGFMVLEKLATKESITFKKSKKLHGLIAEMSSQAESFKLLMPTTYMNDSGKSIRATLDWFGLTIDQLIVVVDDMDLPLGKIRFRMSGSSGGHKGLQSTIEHLNTQNFCRLRIGIGGPSSIPKERKSKTVAHVLGSFQSNEMSLIEQVLEEVTISLDLIHSLGYEKAGNRLNSFKPLED